jgi:putative DNA primase/helicase
MTNETGGPRRPTILPMSDPTVAEAAERATVEPLQTRVGRHWAQENAETFCYDHEREQWMRWDGSRWETERTDAALDSMINFVEALRVRDPRGYKGAANVSFMRSSLSIAAASRLMARKSDDFDADPFLLGVPGGQVNLLTGEIEAPRQLSMISKQVIVRPVKGPCPKWMAFLKQAHAGQEEVVDWLQKFCAEVLLGKQTDHHFAFFYGDGGNGKSQFLETIRELMGDYAEEAQEGTFTRPEKGAYHGHTHVLARLRGKRLVTVSEPGVGDVWDLGRIKAWAGGNIISANHMRQESVPFKPVGMLVCTANHQLKVESVDNAVARRLKYLVWPHKFHGDGYEHLTVTDLGAKIMAEEGPQILWWMIQGVPRLLAEGLGAADVMKREAKNYLREQDTMQRFIDETFVADEQVQPGVNLRDAVAIYNEWARINEAPALKRIGEHLTKKGLSITKTNTERFVRKQGLSGDGMRLMSNILMGRIKAKELTKTEADRWSAHLSEWKLTGEDGEYLDQQLGVVRDG